MKKKETKNSRLNEYIKLAKKNSSWGRGRNKDTTGVVTDDLRALLFWACVGINKSRGGNREKEIGHILDSYSIHLGYILPFTPEFGGELDYE